MGDRFFHKTEAEPYDLKLLEKAEAGGKLSSDDVRFIVEYVEMKLAIDQISNERGQRISITLLVWRRLLGRPFDDVRNGDLMAGIRKLSTDKNIRGVLYTQNTKHLYVNILKPFLLWMVREKYNPYLTEDHIKPIKSPSIQNITKRPEDMLTPDDLKKLLEATRNSRDRALIAMQYELGTRIAELCRLKWQDIYVDDPRYGAKVRIFDRKNQKIRNGIITPHIAFHYLNVWRMDYPGVPEGDNYIFITLQRNKGEMMMYPSVQKVFTRAAKIADLEKKVYTHLLRATRITDWATQGLNEAILKETVWGNQSTSMLKTYIHINPDEQIKSLRRQAGFEVGEDLRPQVLEGLTCPRCAKVNPPTADYCMSCSMALTDRSRSMIEALIESVHSDPDIIDLRVAALEKELHKLKSFLSHPESPGHSG